MASERWNVLFSGRVQGVGFRYRTRLIANNFEVFGWVANLKDGKVQLVVEGEGNQISQFVADIREAMSGYLRDVQVEKGPALGEFDEFEIRRGW